MVFLSLITATTGSSSIYTNGPPGVRKRKSVFLQVIGFIEELAKLEDVEPIAAAAILDKQRGSMTVPKFHAALNDERLIVEKYAKEKRQKYLDVRRQLNSDQKQSIESDLVKYVKEGVAGRVARREELSAKRNVKQRNKA